MDEKTFSKMQIVHHLKDGNKPYATMVANNHFGQWFVGFAVCGGKDQFSRAVGRAIDGHRADRQEDVYSVPIAYINMLYEAYNEIQAKYAELGVNLPDITFTTDPVRRYPYIGEYIPDEWDFLEGTVRVLFVAEGEGYVFGDVGKDEFKYFDNWDETNFRCVLNIANDRAIREMKNKVADDKANRKGAKRK